MVCPVLHNEVSSLSNTIGDGNTVIKIVSGMPTQPLDVGVTITVATTELVPVFTAVKLGKKDVVPVANSPIVGVLFVQL